MKPKIRPQRAYIAAAESEQLTSTVGFVFVVSPFSNSEEPALVVDQVVARWNQIKPEFVGTLFDRLAELAKEYTPAEPILSIHAERGDLYDHLGAAALLYLDARYGLAMLARNNMKPPFTVDEFFDKELATLTLEQRVRRVRHWTDSGDLRVVRRGRSVDRLMAQLRGFTGGSEAPSELVGAYLLAALIERERVLAL
jgi:hypothetical protein